MTQSSTEQSLAAAFVRMQAELPSISLDKKVSYKSVKFEYASLANIIMSCRPVLAKHGLAISQHVSTTDNFVDIKTVIFHVSGEAISSTLRLSSPTLDIKDIGATISYGRRYSLAAMLCCATDGDLDATTIGEIYEGTDDQKLWLKALLTELNVGTDMMKGVHLEMIRLRAEKTKDDAIEILEKLR